MCGNVTGRWLYTFSLSKSNNFLFLVDSGRCAGILGLDAERAVTFAENHDTSQLAIVGGRFGTMTKVLRGYAFILTHPGVPCIYHGDYTRAHVWRTSCSSAVSGEMQASIPRARYKFVRLVGVSMPPLLIASWL